MRTVMVLLAAFLFLCGVTCVGISGYLSYNELLRKTPENLGTDYGGSLAEYIARYEELRHSGRPVVVDGLCISACTLVLATIPLEKLCATPFAKFAFHSAHVMTPFGDGPFSKEGTRIAWNMYPDKVQTYLREHGWDGDGDQEHPDLLYVKATEFIQACAS